MAKRKRNKQVVNVDRDELKSIIDASATGPLSEEQRTKLLETLDFLIRKLDPRFRNSEKLDKLVKDLMKANDSSSDQGSEKDSSADQESEKDEKKQKKRKGNGRTAAKEFHGARKVEVPHEELKRGDQCPGCEKGKVYPKNPEILLRFTGTMPIQATKYELQKLRCNLCGQTYTATPPKDVGPNKYDESVPSTLSFLIYGNGLPRSRLAGLQGKLGVPMAQSTQWDLLNKAADKLWPVLEELIRQAAQREILHSDDTSRQILNLERPENDTRTGVFTSGIIATSHNAPRIALFFTGRQHAGENLADVLRRRAEGLASPIAMHDAASRNIPKIDGEALQVALANCLPHGRRYFVENFKNFPEQCHYVLQELCIVFVNERKVKEEGLTPEERLAYHQTHSGPVMERLHQWFEKQLDDNLVEPNSDLGKSIRYMLRNWPKLTLFLRKPGAPIDNNIAERGLKKAIMHRKNSLFYRTQRGADVGDLFTSLIHTCELNEQNPLHYLTHLLRNSDKLAESPEDWLPWTYQAALAQT